MSNTIAINRSNDPPAVSPDTLWSALARAQSAIGAIVRDTQGARAKYATLDSVLDAVRPALLDAGLVLLQPTVIQAETLFIETRLTHAATGEHVACLYPAGAVTQQHQILGSGVTYARRYSLMALLAVAPEDDDGASAGAAAGRSSSASAPPRTIDTGSRSRPNPMPPRNERGPVRDLPDQTAVPIKRINACVTLSDLIDLELTLKDECSGLSDGQWNAVARAYKARRQELQTPVADEVFP